jgi:hypothetical protein
VTQEVESILANAAVKRPVRCRIAIHEQLDAARSRIVGQTEWIEYR